MCKKKHRVHKRRTDSNSSPVAKRAREVKERMAHLNKLAFEAAEHHMSYGKYVEKLILEGKYDV